MGVGGGARAQHLARADVHAHRAGAAVPAGRAALPGALLPQRSLNQRLVDDYLARLPELGPLLDRLGFFDVFAAPWFAAIYLLLMVSLIGCVLPRTVEHPRRAGGAGGDPAQPGPAAAPRVGGARRDVDEVTARVRTRLRGWRRAERHRGAGTGGPAARTISAEKGYLREVGNLVFHLSLVGLLVGFAAGKLFGYEGQVIVLSGGGQFCNTGILGYDSFRAGLRVDGTDLAPFCVRVDDFTAGYLPERPGRELPGRHRLPDRRGPRGRARRRVAAVPAGGQQPAAARRQPGLPARPRLRAAVHRHLPRRRAAHRGDPVAAGRPGHAAVRGRHEVRPARRHRRRAAPHQPAGGHRPARPDQLRRQGRHLGVPGAARPRGRGRRAARRPRPRRRARPVDLHGDRAQVDSGALVRVARANLVPGQEVRLDDGTTVRFDGVRNWVYLQVSHDPGQVAVLVFAVLVLAGLGLSLAIRRRRFWARLTPSTGPDGRLRTVVELGGLARTDRAGYGEEFDRLRADLLGSHRPEDDRMIALYSDRLFMAAVGVYVLAMFLHAVEYAAARSRRSAVLVGAGGPAGRRRRRRRADAASWTGREVRTRSGRPARPDGRRAGRAGGAAARRVGRHPRAGGRALAAGQHVRVHLGDLPGRGGGLAGGAAPLARPAPGGPVRAAAGGRPDVPGRHGALRPGRPGDAGAAVVLARRARHHDRLASGLLLVPGVASVLYLLRRSGRA